MVIFNKGRLNPDQERNPLETPLERVTYGFSMQPIESKAVN